MREPILFRGSFNAFRAPSRRLKRTRANPWYRCLPSIKPFDHDVLDLSEHSEDLPHGTVSRGILFQGPELRPDTAHANVLLAKQLNGLHQIRYAVTASLTRICRYFFKNTCTRFSQGLSSIGSGGKDKIVAAALELLSSSSSSTAASRGSLFLLALLLWMTSTPEQSSPCDYVSTMALINRREKSVLSSEVRARVSSHLYTNLCRLENG